MGKCMVQVKEEYICTKHDQIGNENIFLRAVIRSIYIRLVKLKLLSILVGYSYQNHNPDVIIGSVFNCLFTLVLVISYIVNARVSFAIAVNQCGVCNHFIMLEWLECEWRKIKIVMFLKHRSVIFSIFSWLINCLDYINFNFFYDAVQVN